MQSQRKFRKEPRLKMNANDFARPFAQNVGSYRKAVLISDNYEFASLQQLKRDDIHAGEKREAVRTANFWNTVGGILRKFQVKMGEQPEPKRHAAPTGGQVEQKNPAN